MTKFTLIIWLCSFLGQYQCLTPVQSSVLYNSWYECSRTAHQESLKMLSTLGYEQVNAGKIATRYMCKAEEIT